MQAVLWTINGLAVELGRDRRATAKALEGLEPDSETTSKGRVTRKWLMARVFAHLYGSEKLDGNAERARRDKESADKLALENAVTRGEQLKRSEVVEVWSEHIVAAKQKLRSIPTKLAPQLINVADPNIIAKRIRSEVDAAIDELAWQSSAASAGAGSASMEEPAELDGQPVGRCKPKAQQ